jgi:Tol biopolymer transport system component
LGYPSGEPRKIIHELDDFSAVSITADSSRIVSVQDKLVSSLWVAPTSDLAHARQLAFDSSRFSQASLGPDGTIFLEKQQGDRRNIWAIAPDGSSQRQLTFEGNNYDPAACSAGPYVVYTCERDGLKGICRIKRDGGTIEQIVPSTAIDVATRCSPNGEFVVYSAWGDGKWPTAWKVSVEGGTPKQLTDKLCFRPAVSPDSGSIACFYSEQPSAQADPDSIAVIPIAGGAPSKQFPLPPTAYTPSGLRWTTDGSGIAYVDNQGGASNIRVQPLDGQPRQLTDFRGDRIFYFEWSADGRQLAFSRGTRSYDVFLIQDVR